MVKRTLEHSPHFVERPKPPAIFGNQESIAAHIKPKRSRGNVPVSGSRRALAQDSVLSGGVVTESGKRGWETFILDKGAGTQETVEGRSYTIGRDHVSIDVWTSPPGTWDAKRIATVNNCRIITVKKENTKKEDDSSNPQFGGWTQAIVVEGTSAKPAVLVPRMFNDGTGSRMYVSVEWSQIRSTTKKA